MCIYMCIYIYIYNPHFLVWRASEHPESKSISGRTSSGWRSVIRVSVKSSLMSDRPWPGRLRQGAHLVHDVQDRLALGST